MRCDEIRETYLQFFEQHGHKRMQSASLVPAQFDASVLLTTAGMQPFKPYFRGVETPPATRLTSCQKCFRTTDIEQVGNTARHLTMFEMLGNFSFGDYFKEEAIGFGYDLSIDGFGFDPAKVWITVFGGDDDLKLGPDEDAIEFWRAKGVPDQQIVRLGRGDNFWQAGPTGPCGPCSELYLDRGLDFGAESDRPGDDSERFLEYWNLVFMQYELHDDGSLTELPARNIDTGMGLERMASILQDKSSVYETDRFWPLIELGQELSGKQYGSDPAVTKALRVLADHGRSMSFLIADGVVPSNEDRGYILRRIMRRAIQQGRTLGLDRFLGPMTERVIESMGDAYPDLHRQRDAIKNWTTAEEASFSRTLDQGTELLNQLIAEARESGSSWIDAADAFKLHDTYGFPYDMTKELLAGEALSVDDSGFEELMDEQRERARSGALRADPSGNRHEQIEQFVRDAERATEFVGYEKTVVPTQVLAVKQDDDSNGSSRLLLKLAESPFYAEGGGQVSDSGTIVAGDVVARVVDVYRLGDDQAVAVEVETGSFDSGSAVSAEVDWPTRFATATHHTATHLLHAALRERLGAHVHQAGSSVRPDKLRFDFAHGQAMTADDIEWVEQRINGWIAENHPVRAIFTSKTEAEKLGAMALFGEKYGDWVRMVEIGDGSFSRELCGGTHVAGTGEIGVFQILAETSSAANVRRIEAIAGPAAATRLLAHDRILRSIATRLRTAPDQVEPMVEQLEAHSKEFQRAAKKDSAQALDLTSLEADAQTIGSQKVIVAALSDAVGGPVETKQLRELSEHVRDKFSAAIVVLANANDGKVSVVANVAPAAVAAGVKAGELVKLAAGIVGGGGGGRDDFAQAGGRDPSKLPEALAAVRESISGSLSG